MQITEQRILMSDDEATSMYGTDWKRLQDEGSFFLAGIEVTAEVLRNGSFRQLEIVPVHDNVDFTVSLNR